MGVKGTLSMLPDTTVFWNNNHATYGGAIYVTDVSPVGYCTSFAAYVSKKIAFFNFLVRICPMVLTSNLFSWTIWLMLPEVFLYRGVIDNCKVTDLDSYSSGEVFDKIAHNEDESITSRHIILSVLLRICPCNNSYPYILCI